MVLIFVQVPRSVLGKVLLVRIFGFFFVKCVCSVLPCCILRRFESADKAVAESLEADTPKDSPKGLEERADRSAGTTGGTLNREDLMGFRLFREWWGRLEADRPPIPLVVAPAIEPKVW